MDENRIPIRETIRRIQPYQPGKPIEEVEREYGVSNIIKLASNENPLGPSPLAIEAMREAVEQVRLYPDNDCYYLRQELADFLGFAPDEVIIGRGSDEVIHMIGLALLNPGEEVIMATPQFTLYDFTAYAMDCEPVLVPMRDFVTDLPAMRERVTDRTKLVFIANPNNPMGTMLTQAEMDTFLDGLPDRVVVVLDEAYYEYVDRDGYPRSLQYVRQGLNVIVLRTFSKIYALAGLRIGYGIARREMVTWLNQVREPFNVSNVAQAAARASLRDPEQVARSQRANQEGKQYLSAEFDRLGLRYVPTQTNFILVDIGVPCRPAFVELLKRGVIVRTADIFGLPTYVRVTIGLPEENRRFISALEEVLGR